MRRSPLLPARTLALLLTTLLVSAATCSTSLAQNPVQWCGNTKMAVDRAVDQSRPLLFWVYDGPKDRDDDDFVDAQEHSFRDPAVAFIIESQFVPVRVSRTSRVLDEAQKLGLPTSHGLYLAVMTADGKLIDQVDPGTITEPVRLAERLAEISRTYRDTLFQTTLRPVIDDPAADKNDVRKAVQTVWRLKIYSADSSIAKLLDRPDLAPEQRTRLYSLMAAFATEACTKRLLDAALTDKSAAAALGRAEPGSLAFLLKEVPPSLPAGETGLNERQQAALAATMSISRAGTPRPPQFWAKGSREDQSKELERVRRKAESVLEYWSDTSGRYR